MRGVGRGRLSASGTALIVASAIALAGCGSSSSNNSSSAATSASGGTTAGPSLTSIKAAITKAETRPTSIGIMTPVSGTIPKGKTIDIIALGEPLGVSQGQDAKAAGAVLGWHVNVINAGATPQTVQAAWSQALLDHPDGIIGTGGFPHSYYAAQLAQAEKDKIPVIEISDPAPPGNGVVVSLDGKPRYVDQGTKLAQWVMAEIGLHANVLIENVPAYTAVNTEVTTMAAYLKAHCSTCTSTILDVAATSSNMAGNIASAVQAHPNVNVVVPITADFSIGLPSALASIARSSLPILSTTQDASYLNYLKAGSVKAVYAYGTPEWVWRAFDAFARVFTHQSTAPDTAHNWPQWWLTPKNVSEAGSDPYGPLVANYQAQFTKLWHVG